MKHEPEKIYKPQCNGSFIFDVEKLTNDILKYFPKFFDDFTNFEYGTGVDAGKDFKKIYNKAKKLNKAVSVINSVCPRCKSTNVTNWSDGEFTCYDCQKYWQTVL